MPAKKKTVSASVVIADSDGAAPKKTLASIGSFVKSDRVGLAAEKSSHTVASGKKNTTVLVLWIVVSVLLLSSVGAALYFYRAYREASEVKPVASEIEELVSRIDAVMELPKGETPTLATVTDKTRLSGQEFFKNAENGDKVLIYESSGKAIVYRPSTGRIMNVAAVNVGNGSVEQKSTESAPQPAAPVSNAPDSSTATPPIQTQSSTSVVDVPAPEGKAKVTLYNGSKTVGVTAKIEKRVLAGLSDSIEVITKDAAAKSDYEGVTVYDVSGVRSKEAAALAALLTGTVVTEAPAGETVPDGTDILVIVGVAKK
ncbi:MAG: hypothetical protein WCL23_00020 [Candidatus Moraniibacteriota bacterium]